MKTRIMFLAFFLVSSLTYFSCKGASEKETSEKKVTKTETVMKENDGVIKLVEPDMTMETTVMNALKDRKSVREYADKQLSLEQMSGLLWAANGINRLETGKRTAPSAVNAQDIIIYVCTPEGAYLYDAANNRLDLVTKEDLRKDIAAGQDFVNEAPACLVLVSDTSRFPEGAADRAILLGAMDAGYVSQNICLYCAAAGLATVPRATMDTAKLKEALKLTEAQIPFLNHPVGYMK